MNVRYSWLGGRRVRKSAAEAYQERRQKRRRQIARTSVLPVSVPIIADRENLYECFQKLRREGGQTPGIDGVSYDLSNMEVGEIVGHLSAQILAGNYRPHPTRPVRIPKPGTSKKRTLNLGVICDRVVGKAVNEALCPYWESIFLGCSYGFRPGRGTWDMLAGLEAEMIDGNCWVIALDDITSAFDSVPIREVIACHRRLLDEIQPTDIRAKQRMEAQQEKSRVLELIETVLQGSDPNKTRGIDQGAPYSPVALNVLLHYRLDQPICDIMRFPSRYFRYADNVAFACRDVSEGRQMLHQSRRLLNPLGLSFHTDGALDLAEGDEAQLLGFILKRKGRRLAYDLGKKGLGQLAQHLGNAHAAENPPATAKAQLRGWIDSAGPAYESGEAWIHDIFRLAAEYGFRELASPRELLRWWEESWSRWQGLRENALRQRGGP